MENSFATNADLLHIATKSVLVKTAHSMTVVERYHAPVRGAFHIIKKETADKNDVRDFQMAIEEINDYIGPDKLVSTLLVFGALRHLRLPTEKPTQTTYQREIALLKGTEATTKHFATLQVKRSLRERHGPDFMKIQNAPIGSPALTYRPEKGQMIRTLLHLALKRERPYQITTTSPRTYYILFYRCETLCYSCL